LDDFLFDEDGCYDDTQVGSVRALLHVSPTALTHLMLIHVRLYAADDDAQVGSPYTYRIQTPFQLSI